MENEILKQCLNNKEELSEELAKKLNQYLGSHSKYWGPGKAMLADLGLTEDQSIYLEDYGHIGQIDQILSLELALKEGKVKDGSTVCMIAAGIGYTWAANIIKWGEA